MRSLDSEGFEVRECCILEEDRVDHNEGRKTVDSKWLEVVVLDSRRAIVEKVEFEFSEVVTAKFD